MYYVYQYESDHSKSSDLMLTYKIKIMLMSRIKLWLLIWMMTMILVCLMIALTTLDYCHFKSCDQLAVKTKLFYIGRKKKVKDTDTLSFCLKHIYCLASHCYEEPCHYGLKKDSHSNEIAIIHCNGHYYCTRCHIYESNEDASSCAYSLKTQEPLNAVWNPINNPIVSTLTHHLHTSLQNDSKEGGDSHFLPLGFSSKLYSLPYLF
jgi:hypothetical protein